MAFTFCDKKDWKDAWHHLVKMRQPWRTVLREQVTDATKCASLGTQLRGCSREGGGEGKKKKRAGTLIHLPEVWWDIHCLLFHLVLMIAWHISMLQVHNVFRARKHHLHTNWGVLFLRAAFEFQWCLCLLSHDWTEHFRLWRNNSSEGLWLMWLFFPLSLFFSFFFLVLFFLLSPSNLFCLGKPETAWGFWTS